MDYDPDQIIFYVNVLDMFKSVDETKCMICNKSCESKKINDRAKRALENYDPSMSIEYPIERPWYVIKR